MGDYYDMTWDKALCTADFALMQLGSIYYHPHICEVPDAIPSSTAIAPDTSKQPLAIQITVPPFEASKGSNQVGDESQWIEGDKDKGKGKEKKPSLEAKNATKDKDAVAKKKEAEAQTKEVNPKAKDAPTSQLSQKEDPPAPKSKAQHLGFLLQFFFFWQWYFVAEYNVLLFI